MLHSFSAAAICYRWRCTKCGADAFRSWLMAPGSQIPIPDLPQGWHQLDEWTFLCAEHTITTLIDGEVRPCP